MAVMLGGVDLESGVVTLDKGSFNMGRPDLRRNRRQMRGTLTFIGDDLDEVARHLSLILTELRSARRIALGLDTGERVRFLWQPGDVPIWFDLLPDQDGECGYLDLPENATAWLDISWAGGVPITLNTAAYGYGLTEHRAASATLTNGASLLHLPNIPGDAPPIVSLTIDTTVSTNSVIPQRIRLGARSLPDMASGDFDPWVDADAGSGGSTVTVAGTVGGTHERRAATTSWQQVATYTKPAGSANMGRFHLLPRLRDNALNLLSPTDVDLSLGSPFLAYVGDTPQYKRESTYQDPNDTSLVVALPGQVTDGNLLIAACASNEDTTTITPPTGFVSANSAANAAGGSNGIKAQIFYKANAGPADTVTTWTVNAAGNGLDITIFEVEGMLTASVLDTSAVSNTGANVTLTGIAQPNELAIGLSPTGIGTNSPAFGSPWGNLVGWGFSETYQHNTNSAVAWRFLNSTNNVSTRLSGAGGSATVAAAFKGKSTGAGFLPWNTTYEVAVCAVSAGGIVGPSSIRSSYTVQDAFVDSQPPVALYVTWTAPSSGDTPSQYRVYFRIAGGPWFYVNTGSTSTSYSLTTFTGATQGDPPDYTSTRSEFRFLYGMESGTTQFATPAFDSDLTSTAWQMPGFTAKAPPATVTLPPNLNEDGAASEDWKVALQGRNVAGQTTDMDADVMALFPAGHDEPTLELEPYSTLTAARVFEYHQRADGRAFGILRDGSGNEVGGLKVSGGLNIGPGDCTLVAALDVASDVSDVVDAKATLAVSITPRWLFLGRNV